MTNFRQKQNLQKFDLFLDFFYAKGGSGALCPQW